jgi:hypothetical protein
VNGRTAALLLLSAVFCAQIAAPVFMIAQREKVLRRGETFRFRCAPVDPADAFRGRYVAIRLESNTAPAAVDFAYGQRVFVTVETDANGFAQFTGARPDRPDGYAWIRTRARWSHMKGRTQVDPTMNRFYMEESEAPRAEAEWREATRWNRTNHTAAVVARVYRGMAVIRDLEIDGRPIRDVLRDPEPR